MSNAELSENYGLEEVQVSLSPQERFEEYLQSRKMRFTQERRVLLEHIFQRHEHFDANALIDELSRVLEKRTRPGRATVYRTLKELVDAGLLRKFDVGGRTVYEHDYGYPQHDHLHCKMCERLIEFHSAELHALRERVARDHGFRVTGHRLIISGVCDECLRSRRRVRRSTDLI